MGLTGLFTMLIAIFSTFFVTFGTAIFWRHIFRKGFVNLFLRTFLLILCQALALTSVGLAVNRSNGFFETWSDLFGTGANYSTVAVTDSLLPTLTPADISKAVPLSGGAVMVKDIITGAQSKVSNSVYLYLPRQVAYALKNKKKIRVEKLQVVEFLTGYPSQPIMWFKVMKIERELAGYNVAHPKSQIVGIFPQVNVAGNYDLECMNLPHGKPQAETWLSKDMHTYLAKRTGITKQQWSIMGLSTGGWCSAMLSMRHPDLYDRAVSIAGYYRPALPLKDPIALQNWAKHHYSLNKFESRLPKKLRLYLVASLGDRYSIKETRKFLALSHPNLLIKYRELTSGGHNPHVWVPSIKPALDWL
ncbi:MAG: alpha/beta hydrolase [Candidatus Planktophila sp.]